MLGVGGGMAAKAATTAASGKLASAAAGKLCGGKLVAPFVQAASAGLLAGPAGAVAGGVAGEHLLKLIKVIYIYIYNTDKI